jgi:hypothetical protein
MIHTAQLWLPILLTAIGVFIASSLIHTVLKWHNSDYRKLGNEDDVRAAISRGAPAPGMYVVPHHLEGPKMSPELQKKFVEGPIAFIMLRPSGLPRIGPLLAKWFLLNLLVAALVAHVAACAIGAGSPGHTVFHIVALITFLAYGAGAISDGIWYGRPWGAVIKDLLDALIYAIVSGAIFCWLWPHAGSA